MQSNTRPAFVGTLHAHWCKPSSSEAFIFVKRFLRVSRLFEVRGLEPTRNLPGNSPGFIAMVYTALAMRDATVCAQSTSSLLCLSHSAFALDASGSTEAGETEGSPRYCADHACRREYKHTHTRHCRNVCTFTPPPQLHTLMHLHTHICRSLFLRLDALADLLSVG